MGRIAGLLEGLSKLTLPRDHPPHSDVQGENVRNGAPLRHASRQNAMRRVTRLLSALCVTIFLVGLLLFGGIYFLIQGSAGSGSVIVTEIEKAIESVIGPDYDVIMSEADLDLSDVGSVSLKSFDVSILRNSDGAQLAAIGEIRANASVFDLLVEKGSFNHISIDGAVMDAALVGSGDGLLLPRHLDKPFNALGQMLLRLEENLNRQGFEDVSILNSRIVGKVFGRTEQSDVKISSLILDHDESDTLRLLGDLSTELSTINLNASYKKTENNSSELEFQLSGLKLREWLDDPQSEEGIIAMDNTVSMTGKVPFDEKGLARNPSLRLTLDDGTLRVGEETRTTVQSAEFNIGLFLDRNQIELERSQIAAERFKGLMIGGIKPADADLGYEGPLRFDFIVEHGQFAPTLENEPVEPAAFQVAGQYDRVKQNISARKIVLTTKDGAVTGQAEIGLAGETPSVTGTLETSGISVLALKHYWPFFVAHKAREWVHEHIAGGWVEQGRTKMQIPAGILFRLDEGAKLAPEHYKTEFNVRDFAFRPFGDMPRITDGVGTVELEGMKISANLESGKAADHEGKEINILGAGFVMEDFGAKEKTGETKLELDGNIRSIARISDREPLRVMQRMKVTADQFSGNGHADIIARFPVGRKISYEEVDWNVLLEMTKGKSSKPLAGRGLTDADLLIDANSNGATVTGTARIDGIKAKLKLTEPVGKSGKVKRKRIIQTTLSAKDREKLGFDLKPVVTGPMSIVIEQTRGKEIHKLDLTESEVSLPWIGWTKGAGIKSKGGFELTQSKGHYILENFQLTGAGFDGKGKLILTKKGLQSANFSSIQLNEGDDIQLKVERKKDTYNINASGLSYDARSVMNTLIHSGGFTRAQGGRSVNLVANFDKIRGFNNRIVRNAILLYESRGGRLSRLDMTANGSDGRSYTVQAQLNGNDTLFSMATNDAGTALAFTDIYTRMERGSLEASLLQSEAGPFIGPVRIKQFNLVNEPRLARLASNVKSQIPTDRGSARREIIPDAEDKVIKFQLADAKIERGTGYLNVQDAVIRSGTMGLTAAGKVYDAKDRIALSGTFMPANSLNLAVSKIPILGQLLSNGRDNALIGISYSLQGMRKDPQLVINPLSIVTPGVFNRVFEFDK